jgi:hypothetical protein
VAIPYSLLSAVETFSQHGQLPAASTIGSSGRRMRGSASSVLAAERYITRLGDHRRELSEISPHTRGLQRREPASAAPAIRIHRRWQALGIVGLGKPAPTAGRAIQ